MWLTKHQTVITDISKEEHNLITKINRNELELITGETWVKMGGKLVVHSSKTKMKPLLN